MDKQQIANNSHHSLKYTLCISRSWACFIMTLQSLSKVFDYSELVYQKFSTEHCVHFKILWMLHNEPTDFIQIMNFWLLAARLSKYFLQTTNYSFMLCSARRSLSLPNVTTFQRVNAPRMLLQGRSMPNFDVPETACQVLSLIHESTRTKCRFRIAICTRVLCNQVRVTF